MKKIQIFLFINVFFLFNSQLVDLIPENSFYYEEKFFRFLTNNYETIDEGTFWTKLENEKGIGFKASRDFGSAIILKDWSLYSFKLTKIIFRPYCTVNLTTTTNVQTCDAEMWLYHTKDNGYYPPGRRIHINANYLVIVVPFRRTSDNNPATDKLLHFLQLDKHWDQLNSNGKKKVGPLKNVKLYQIIQDQPSYLFDGQLPTGEESLFMIFSQYHFISDKDYSTLSNSFKKTFGDDINNCYNYSIIAENDIYRNWENIKILEPKATLLAYSNSKLIKSLSYLFGLLVIILF